MGKKMKTGASPGSDEISEEGLDCDNIVDIIECFEIKNEPSNTEDSQLETQVKLDGSFINNADVREEASQRNRWSTNVESVTCIHNESSGNAKTKQRETKSSTGSGRVAHTQEKVAWENDLDKDKKSVPMLTNSDGNSRTSAGNQNEVIEYIFVARTPSKEKSLTGLCRPAYVRLYDIFKNPGEMGRALRQGESICYDVKGEPNEEEIPGGIPGAPMINSQMLLMSKVSSNSHMSTSGFTETLPHDCKDTPEKGCGETSSDKNSTPNQWNSQMANIVIHETKDNESAKLVDGAFTALYPNVNNNRYNSEMVDPRDVYSKNNDGGLVETNIKESSDITEATVVEEVKDEENDMVVYFDSDEQKNRKNPWICKNQNNNPDNSSEMTLSGEVECNRIDDNDNSSASTIVNCIRCNTSFTDRTQLLRHAPTHNKEGYHPCVLCESFGPSMEWFIYHWNNQHKFYTADNKGNDTASKNGFDTVIQASSNRVAGQVKINTELLSTPQSSSTCTNTVSITQLKSREPSSCNDMNTWRCTICEKKFKYNGCLYRHMRDVHICPKAKSDSFVCDKCGKKFKSKYNVKIHQQRDSCPNASGYSCPQCPKTFTTKANLRKHREYGCSAAVKNFSCDKCDKAFALERLLQIHQQCHTDAMYKCETCGRSYVSEKCYKQHLSKGHQKREYVCDLCGLSFPVKHKKYNHKLQVHLKDSKQFLCNYCGKGFPANTLLQFHIRTKHTHSDKYKCTTCNKGFGRKSHLEIHVKYVHLKMKKKECVCEICGKYLKNSKQLSQHKKSHLGIKPFKCERCPASFLIKEALNVHIRSHTGETPFACKECDKRFKTSSQLKTHAKKHSDVREHKCSICSEEFKLPHHLRAHVARKHAVVL